MASGALTSKTVFEFEFQLDRLLALSNVSLALSFQRRCLSLSIRLPTISYDLGDTDIPGHAQSPGIGTKDVSQGGYRLGWHLWLGGKRFYGNNDIRR